MTNRQRFSRRIRARSEHRGFTLIELLVAIIAGMLVAASAFAFAKSSTRFFSQEARIASAQMSVITGFQRLQADIARASYLGTPNMPRDRDFHRVCAPDFTNWSPIMKDLVGVRVTSGGSGSAVTLPDGNLPDTIRIAGSFAAADMFPVANVELGTEGSVVTLGTNNGALARAGVRNDDGGVSMNAVFKPGRILRILDMDGNLEFGLITEATYANGGQPEIKTKEVIPVKGTDDPNCGVGGYGTQSQASVISIIEYGIVKVSANSGGTADIYQKTIYSEAGSAYGDESRTELVRREILGNTDPPDLANDTELEVIAEYAVDLRFGLWVGGAAGSGLTYIPPSAATTTRTKPDTTYTEGTAPTGPESVRAIDVRLAVRSREVDRAEMMDPALTGVAVDGGFMFRFPLPNNGGVARVRTLVANVTLENQRGDTWQ